MPRLRQPAHREAAQKPAAFCPQVSRQTQNGDIVTWISYAGDEGGIMCRSTPAPIQRARFTSITHLRFDPRLPLAREIGAYQKHRVKRLRRRSR